MKKTILISTLCVISTFSFAKNAAPFGQEIGVTKCSDVFKNLSNKASFTKGVTNQETDVTTYIADAKNLGLAGAKTIIVGCDNSDTLTVVDMEINDNISKNFNNYTNTLKSKYKLIQLSNPKSGDKLAKFSQGTSKVLLFTTLAENSMHIIYITNSALSKLDNALNAENQSQLNEQQDNL